LDTRNIYTLRTLSEMLEERLRPLLYNQRYWVRTEIARLNHYHQNGHCYPEFVQKEAGIVVATWRGTIWRGNFERINSTLRAQTGQPIGDNMEVLCLAEIKYTAQYGLQLNIHDIDPTYTLGMMAREREEAIRRLEAEGLIGLNKLLPLPVLPRRLAIISVTTSRGFQDFVQQVEGNRFGYRITWEVLPAALEGERAIAQIRAQLANVERRRSEFDAVLLLRGGGDDAGLSWYNNFELAKAVATCPLPVITGIGHAANVTVTELVAARNCITPTAAAQFVVELFEVYHARMLQAWNIIRQQARQALTAEKARQHHLLHRTTSSAAALLTGHQQALRQHARDLAPAALRMLRSAQTLHADATATLQRQCRHLLRHHDTRLAHLEQQVHLQDPQHLLNKGYSITLHRGEVVKDASGLVPGDQIETRLAKGIVQSTVLSNSKTDG
jgi:exodeoxyribonuclease VII large subunit